MNLGAMLQRLCDMTGERTDHADVMRRYTAALNETGMEIESEQLREWMFVQQSMAVTATESGDTLPTGCRAISYVVLDGTGRRLGYKPEHLDTLDRGHPSIAGGGTPEVWDAVGRLLYLRPYPSAATTVTLGMLSAWVDLSATTNEPLLPAHFHHVLIDGALMRIASGASFDPAVYRAAEKRYERGLRAIAFTGATAQPKVMQLRWLEGEFTG